jgi:uncharacterized integral membrane protein
MTSARPSSRRTVRLTPRQIIAIVLAVAALVFVFQNREETRIQFITATFQAPLWMVLLVMLGVGIFVGRFLRRQRR